MSKLNVLVEVFQRQPEAFSLHATASGSEVDAVRESEKLVANLASFGLEVTDAAPVPFFGEKPEEYEAAGLAAFSSHTTNKDVEASSFIVPCEIPKSKQAELEAREDVKVWPNSPLTLYQDCECARTVFEESEPEHLFDLANSAAGVDCRPFRPGVTVSTIRELLGVETVWSHGFRGQNIVVGIIDEGVNGDVYPVVGGFSRPRAQPPGGAHVRSHGSMCAADVLVAAPAAKLYDYPFLGIANSGGAITMFQAVLNQRRVDGTPQLTNNSYGFVGRPPKDQFPNHEVWNINHPVHRKVREVIASGAPALFAAGNCGEQCPSGNCHSSGIGPGKSIHASNSLEEVITVAAVNSRHERIGYSSQGPGGFFRKKPDVAAYSHLFGNFGTGRPGGTPPAFDNGTSAATPVAAGVCALLLSAFPDLTPQRLKDALISGAFDIGTPGWDANTGFGVVNAAASYNLLVRDIISDICGRRRRRR
jgi:subtilisin family serine protease